jgi:outer membrane lipoprotein-sorting protein
VEEFNTDSGRYYILTVLRGGYRTEILRKVWFDRSDLQVTRLENFAPKGLLMADIQLSDWRATDSPAPGTTTLPVTASSPSPLGTFAHTIEINRPHDDYRLDLQVSKITINEPIAASRFQLLQPPGSELVQVSEANAAKDQKP